MNGTRAAARRTGLSTPRRNRFFHGKMMDVYQFELETAYGIEMRRLLNRLVTGDGVVCGLDVIAVDGECAIEVTSGVAIDGWGREIVVPIRTAAIPIPPELVDRVCDRSEEPGYETSGYAGDHRRVTADREEAVSSGYRRPDPEAWVTAVLCYHECETEPVAVLAGDCSTTTPCAPGAIHEQYRIAFEPGRVDPIELRCRIPDVLTHGELDYAALATWVTRECPAPPRNSCIPLANVRLDCGEDACSIDDIDITVRPLVIGNEVLVDLLARVVNENRAGSDHRR
jgi:hypothetical protein